MANDMNGSGPGLFDWADAFRIEDQLDQDERMLRNTAHGFALDRLQTRVMKAFNEESTDPSVFREMGEAGLLGVTGPEEYGGLAATVYPKNFMSFGTC